MKLFTYTAIVLLLIVTKLSAQVDTAYSPRKLYTQSQLLADFELFKNVLIEAHPSLYRYQSKAAMDSAFARAAAQVIKPMTEIEFWRVLEPVVVSIHSGHTDLYTSGTEAAWHHYHSVHLLPGDFFIHNDSIFMIKRQITTISRTFRPVISINGVSSKKVIALLRQYTSSDALSYQFADFKLQGFDFSKVYGQVNGYSDVYKISLIDYSGVQKDTTLKVKPTYFYIKTANNFRSVLEDRKDELNQVVSVDYPADMPSTAILKIKNFTYFNYYLSFHDGLFKQLKADKIKNLVIDVRGNTGGFASIGLDLIRYLTNGRCTQILSEQRQTNKITFDKYIMKNASYDVALGNSDKVEKYKFQLQNFRDEYSYTENNFDKNVYLLVDKGTFSAGSIFASALKNQRKVTVIGEETGGCEAGTDGGFSTIELPNTKMLLHLPRYWENTAASHPHSTHGLIPDIEVKSNLPTWKVGDDDAVKKVKELILEIK